ncbi:hypothetical protein CHARACLAT_017376 [Characodon lateralis]|uniref:Uncharacterized protein n=1 Tax=Characodon lateralis TaxID=208331 RepID=A0ABU7EUZ2_9TELE|nr:hypothetical protein [Characodon lateralis]
MKFSCLLFGTRTNAWETFSVLQIGHRHVMPFAPGHASQTASAWRSQTRAGDSSSILIRCLHVNRNSCGSKLQTGRLLSPELAFKQIAILSGNTGLSSLELNNLQIVSPSHEQKQHFK